ncbi:MAG: putative pyridoxamine 5-phosphate oxidase-related, FMN-binding core [Modestobacter sp.]|nr:putative pyridoxamine 5-phosphate oxidase-related, FMN-binding core [Modestobacter sp.]
MASFADLEPAEPELAARVLAAFDAHGHKVLATLRRDPRMALHSDSDEPADFTADAKVSGRAAEVTGEEVRARFAATAEVPADQPFELFHVELEQVVPTAVSDDRSALVISSWRPGRGVTRTERT